MNAELVRLVQSPYSWAPPDLPCLPVRDAALKLAAYLELLLAWNSKFNLVGCGDPHWLLSELIQDSFYLVRFLEEVFPDYETRKRLRICEPGAGAGLPGVPLRILWPFGEYYWIERSSKRAIFLQNVEARLCLGMRGSSITAEKYFRGGRVADCIVSRAFMPWQRLLPLCEPGLGQNGAIIIMANEAPPDLPRGWQLAAMLAYKSARKKRWFWAIARDAA